LILGYFLTLKIGGYISLFDGTPGRVWRKVGYGHVEVQSSAAGRFGAVVVFSFSHDGHPTLIT
jgi:hypothetical protein